MKQIMFFWATCLLTCTVATGARAESLVWKSLEEGPSALVDAYQNDKSISVGKPNPKIAKFVEVIKKGQKAPVYLVDPNTEDLCGSAGCSVAAYTLKKNRYVRILDVLVEGRTPPPGDPGEFITVSTEMRNGFPCLDLVGLSSKSAKARWCYNGKKYDFSRVRK